MRYMQSVMATNYACKLMVTVFLSASVWTMAGEKAKRRTKATTIDNTSFAVNLYKTTVTGKGNAFISPYSVSSAMVMVYVGADGNTAKELATSLRLQNKKVAVHKTFKALKGQLMESTNKTGNTLSIANGLCLTNGDVSKKYKVLLKAAYEAEVFKGDVKTINDWVKTKTKGKIPKILDQLQPHSVCVLLNAIYFKGKWQAPFEEDMTELEPFHLSSGKKVEVPLMNYMRYCRIGVGKGFKAISLPYKGRKTSMVIVLPDKVNGLPAFEKDLTSKKLRAWLNSLDSNQRRLVNLYLPKFKFETSYDLVPTFKALGVKDAFSAAKGDFRSMGKRKGELFISQIQHRAFIEVNEEGTEAVAVTGIGAEGSIGVSKPPKFILFKADHPFLFLIRDNATGTILFMGRVVDPRTKAPAEATNGAVDSPAG